MKLSEAIRLGSMLTEQVFGKYTEQRDGVVVGACALGAALTAGYRRDLYQESIFAMCPGCHQRLDTRLNLITHLNDDHRWTREQIADAVERWEQADVVPSCPVLVGSTRT